MPFGDISVSIHPARLASVIPDPLSAPKLPRASSPIRTPISWRAAALFRPSECVAFPARSILRIYTSAALLTPSWAALARSNSEEERFWRVACSLS